MTAPRCFPRVHASTTFPRQFASSALSPHTSSLYPAAAVWTAVWQNRTLPRRILEMISPTPTSSVRKSSPLTSNSLQTSFVTEQPTTPFHLKCSTARRSVVDNASCRAAKSPTKLCLTRRGSSKKEPSSMDTGAASAELARISMPKAFDLGRSSTFRRMPELIGNFRPLAFGLPVLLPVLGSRVATASASARARLRLTCMRRPFCLRREAGAETACARAAATRAARAGYRASGAGPRHRSAGRCESGCWEPSGAERPRGT
mmetsp:Transcript_46374/g.107105  ORF Transcript_46374/g.107105 Transcript_46374/m.107105 type:complete len:260 (-) Transcript_46374:55-834(-)